MGKYRRPKNNLLFLSRISGWGGAEKSLMELLKRLDKDKFQPFLVLPDKKGMLYAEAVKNSIDVIIVNMPFLHITYNPFKLLFFMAKVLHINMVFLSILKKMHISMAVCNTVQDSIFIALPAKIMKRKLIIYIKGILDKRWKKVFRSRVCDLFADRVITVSERVRDDVARYMRNIKKVNVIYEGINVASFKKGLSVNDVFQQYMSRDSQCFKIINIGNIANLKGQKLLIEALSCTKFKHINFKVFFLGEVNFKKDIPYKRSVEELIDKNGMAEKVFFLGFKNNVNDYIKYSDMLVHCPVLEEGLGLVILEAFCFNKIVVATGVGGIPEIIEDGVNGYLCKVDKNDLAEKIFYVYKNRYNLGHIGYNAAKTIEKKFSLEKQIEKTEQVYSDLLNL